jgi:hypothetical protein
MPPLQLRHNTQHACLCRRYLHGVLNRLGPPAALVPMPPPLTRYKREVAVKQASVL